MQNKMLVIHCCKICNALCQAHNMVMVSINYRQKTVSSHSCTPAGMSEIEIVAFSKKQNYDFIINSDHITMLDYLSVVGDSNSSIVCYALTGS